MKLLLTSFFCLVLYYANAQSVKMDSISNQSVIDTVVISKFKKPEAFESVLSYLHSRSGLGNEDLRPLRNTDPIDGKITFEGHAVKNILVHRKPNDKGSYESIALNYKGTVYLKDYKFKILLSNLNYQYGYRSDLDIPEYAIKLEKQYVPLSTVDTSNENQLMKELAKSLIVNIAQKTNIKSDSDF